MKRLHVLILCVVLLVFCSKLNAKVYEFLSIGSVYLDEPLSCDEDQSWTILEINSDPNGYAEYCLSQASLIDQFALKLTELQQYDVLVYQQAIVGLINSDRAKEKMKSKIVEIQKEIITYQLNVKIDQEMLLEMQEANKTVEVDIDKPSIGRSLSKNEFQRVVKSRAKHLINCIDKEVEINPNQKKFVVEVTVQNTGKFIYGHMISGSKNGTRCVFKALQGLKVEPFDGPNYIGRIPFELE